MGGLRLLGSGVNLHGTPTQTSAAPVAGEHTREVLAEVGLASQVDADGGDADPVQVPPAVVTADGSQG
jgi:hypothetical protein